MRKLNKLLLMGAALSGALIPKAGASSNIKVNDIVTDFTSSGNDKTNDKMFNDIKTTYSIKLKGLKWSGNKYDRIRYYILTGLKEYLKLPIIEKTLEEYNKNTKNCFIVSFEEDYKKGDKHLMGDTSWSKITLYGDALIDNDLLIKGNKRYKDMGHKLALQNIKDRWNVTQEDIDVYEIQSTLAHELGHLVSNVQEAKYNQKNVKKFECDEPDNQRWLRMFYVEYYNDLKNNNNIKAIPWDDLLESDYGNKNLEDWFAESFCRAVFPGDHMGESKVSKQFGETLSRISGIRNCLTP